MAGRTARPATRHGRRNRRATPRRWLPFLVLVAVVAAAVVVAQQDDEPVVEPERVAAPGSYLPVVSGKGALSTAWFCAGGTAQGPEGPAELSLVVANASGKGARAEVLFTGSNGQRRRATVQVPANGRKRLVAREQFTSEWMAATVEVFGGRATVEREVSGPDGFDVSPCSVRAAATWHVPSGSTVRGATELLALYNPFPYGTSVDISFATDDGPRTPRALQGVSIAARSVRMVEVNAYVARRKEVAAEVTTRTGRVVVDRVQLYDGSGDMVSSGDGDEAVVTDAPRGVVSTAALPEAAPRWFFPGAVRREGGRTQVAIANPGRTRAEVDVAISFQDPTRQPEIEPAQLTVRPGEQVVFDLASLTDLVPDVGFSIDVDSISGVPVLSEVLVFDGDPADVHGASVLAGSQIAATRWLVSGRGSSSRRTGSVVVANPGAAATTVRVQQLVGGDLEGVAGATVTIPAGDRRVLDLGEAEPGAALVVRSGRPVVVQRSIFGTVDRGTSMALAAPYPEWVADLPTSD
jgi:hypothetical protein